MITTIPFSAVDEGDRYRKDYGDLSDLQNSIATLGSIHPIALSHSPNGTFKLIAGGRRYRCMKNLGVRELHHASILDPAKLGFVFAEEVAEELQREAELDENLHRMEMKWAEKCLLIADIHGLKKAKNIKWGGEQTAMLLGSSKALVNQAIRMAKLIRARDPEILTCSTMQEAIALLTKRKEEEALAELQKRAEEVHGVSKLPDIMGAHRAFPSLDTLSIDTTKKTRGEDEPTNLVPFEVPGLATPNTPTPAVIIPLSSRFILGDSMTILPTLPSSSFDHIVTDIPYGIDMDNLDEAMVADVKDEHDVAQNVDMMQPFLRESFRLLKSGGFCVFFYDLDHHEKLQTWAAEVGFKVQRWPFVACKTSPARNGAAQYNTCKNYEVAMFLRKDEQTVLRHPITSSWKAYDFSAERRLYSNPFAKPSELWRDIYDAIAFPGQTVFDPYCGQMSSCRAAVNFGLVPFGIEKKEKHYNAGLNLMRSVYALVHGSNVSFT